MNESIDASDIVWKPVTGKISHVAIGDQVLEVDDEELRPVALPIELAPGITLELITEDDEED